MRARNSFSCEAKFSRICSPLSVMNIGSDASVSWHMRVIQAESGLATSPLSLHVRISLTGNASSTQISETCFFISETCFFLATLCLYQICAFTSSRDVVQFQTKMLQQPAQNVMYRYTARPICIAIGKLGIRIQLHTQYPSVALNLPHSAQ